MLQSRCHARDDRLGDRDRLEVQSVSGSPVDASSSLGVVVDGLCFFFALSN